MLRKPSTASPGCCGRRLRSPILGTLAALCLLALPASPVAAQIAIILTDDTLTPVDELYFTVYYSDLLASFEGQMLRYRVVGGELHELGVRFSRDGIVSESPED